MANIMLKAAAMKWDYYVMDISTDSAKIKSFWERRKKKKETENNLGSWFLFLEERERMSTELASYQCDFYH